jgi:ornithine carbamoyltransferase
LDKAVGFASSSGSRIELSGNPAEGVRGADIVYTDVWISMGQESEYDTKIKAFDGFRVNSELMKLAKPSAIFMHCLPAHRGEEVTDDVIDSPQSVVFDQAENRLHTQKAIVYTLLKGGEREKIHTVRSRRKLSRSRRPARNHRAAVRKR